MLKVNTVCRVKGELPPLKVYLLPLNVRNFRVKGPIFLKNRHFIIQKRSNKLIYGINTIIKCGT